MCLPQSVLGLLAGGSGECSVPCLCRDDDEGSVVRRKSYDQALSLYMQLTH